MLTRALLLLLGVGLAAAANNRDYNNGYGVNDMVGIKNDTKIFCYLNGTRIDRNSQFRLEISRLSIDKCDYVVYGAAVITPQNTVEAINRDLESDTGINSYARLNSFKRINNNNNIKLKTILSIQDAHNQFSKMARSSEYRTQFIESVSNYLKRHAFDGVNIDWQYPGRRPQSQTDDKQNFNLFIQELKSKIRNDGKLLTAVLPPTLKGLEEGFDYENDNLLENIDYWFIMALEYYNHAFNTIGANAPIVGYDGGHDVSSTIFNIRSKDRLKRDIRKIVLVIPFYGKQYALVNEIPHGESPIGQPFTNRNSAVDYVQSYHDVCKTIQSAGVDNWMRGTDPKSKTPYAVNGRRAILYEDYNSIAEKTRLALQNGLGGVMAFSLDLDDFDGTCANNHGVHNQYNNNYNNKHNPNEQLPPNSYPLLLSMHETVVKGSGGPATATLSLLAAFVTVALLIIQG